MKTTLDEAAEAIAAASELALACHMAPDGDALGSLLALHHLCLARGRTSVASWSQPFEVAPHYRFLPGLDLLTKPEDFPRQPELMVTFDCGSLDRLGDLAEPAQRARQLLVIDHHVTNTQFGTINLVDPAAAASAVIVRQLAERLGWDLTYEAAICLYTGLVTDTGRFQYENTTPDVFAMATELSAFGLPIQAITRQLFEEHTFAYLRLIGECMSRARLDCARRFVATWITADDLDRLGIGLDETEGMIDLVRRASEADVSCVLKEVPGGVRVSLRAVSDTDVSAVAARFGGGGHRFAAGFTTAGTIDEVLDRITSFLPPR
jgi:phosphoesterase RecJ-like protein